MHFINDKFLLQSIEARTLYHEFAKGMPIIDYHTHLPPEQVSSNHKFRNIAEIWLGGDHYKWRLMRTCGVEERLITGDASDHEKFRAWASVVPKILRNPIYHWTHMELKDPFGIEKLLDLASADEIFEQTSAMLAEDQFSTQGLLKHFNVKAVCTTDDPVSDLSEHQKYANQNGRFTKMYPTWRPDKIRNLDDLTAFNQYVDHLGTTENTDINTFASLLEVFGKRHQFFHNQGCRCSDHGVSYFFAESFSEKLLADIFEKARNNKQLTEIEKQAFSCGMLYHFSLMDHEKGWTQQYHIGVLRNNNTRYFKTLGPDAGFDSIGDFPLGVALKKHLDRLDAENKLTKTILYSINPCDNEVIATMIGNFQDGTIPGKMQFGSAWWFMDQKEGMERQINTLSNLGVLSLFVGMLTDSRSFLSYSRHEYFRRILCNILGNDMRDGLIPSDLSLVGKMVQDICYNNAERYFGFQLD